MERTGTAWHGAARSGEAYMAGKARIDVDWMGVVW